MNYRSTSLRNAHLPYFRVRLLAFLGSRDGFWRPRSAFFIETGSSFSYNGHMSKEQFVVEGLAGERSLQGSIPIRGAKNAVLKAMAASLLFEDPLTITNVPAIEYVERTVELLEDLGASV